MSGGDILDKLYREGNKKDDLTRKGIGWQPIGSALITVLHSIVDSKSDDDGGCGHQFDMAIQYVSEGLRSSIKESFDLALKFCESPIEKRILPWLLCQRYQFFDGPIFLPPPDRGNKLALHDRTIAIVPQLCIGKYRVDFAIVGRIGIHTKAVIIECDGAQYHDDVHKDIKRDAALMGRKEILDVISITGKEIWKDPEHHANCVARQITWLWSKTNKSMEHKFQ